MGSQSVVPQIASIDVSMEPGSSAWLSTCRRVRLAMEEHGCFVAHYDKLSSEFRSQMFDSLQELFDLPQEIKMKNVNPKPAHGYMGKISAFPLHEGMGIEGATDLDECKKFTNLMWPEGNDRFCDVAHSYANMVAELEKLVIKMLFESYGVTKKHYEDHSKSTTYLLRFLKYRRRPVDESNVGFKGHTDKSFMSILHSNHVKGLEIRTNNGEWLSFQPSPSSFIVIVGDALMAWSNDRIKSCYHRVLVSGEEVRYALGSFSFAGGIIEPPEELVDDEHPLSYKPFDHMDLLRFYLSNNDPGKGERNMMKVFCGI